MIDIRQLRFVAADRAGIGDFSGSLADLKKEEREVLIDTMAIIVNEDPSLFENSLKDFARKRIASPFFQKPFDEFTASDALSTFGSEFGTQAKEILTLQAGTIKTALLLAAVAFGITRAIK